MTLKAAVAEQAPRYAEIKAPIMIIAGDESDKTVSTNIHSRPLAEDRTECEADRAAGGRPHGAERRARTCDLRDRGDGRQDDAGRGGDGRELAPQAASHSAHESR